MKPSASSHTHNEKSVVDVVIKIDCTKTIPASSGDERALERRETREEVPSSEAESDKH